MEDREKIKERMRTLFVENGELHDGFKAFLELIALDKMDDEQTLLTTYDEKRMFEARALVNYQGQLLDRMPALLRGKNEDSRENSRDTGPHVY